MYHGTHYEDVVDHIAKVLKMIDLIYVPGVDSHQLRMKVETDIRQKDEKSSKNGQNRARNGKAWKSQSQIEAKVNPDKVKAKKSSSQRKYNFRDQICQILKLYNKDKYYKD
ncbi:hypothetical protein Tco_0097747 [Tanacetum coccineum]